MIKDKIDERIKFWEEADALGSEAMRLAYASRIEELEWVKNVVLEDLRDKFANTAMQEYLRAYIDDMNPELVSREAYKQADTMLAHRNKSSSKGKVSKLFNLLPWCIDSKGPVPYGVVRIFQANSNNLARTYMDKEGEILQCNPVVLDNAGSCSGIFIDDGEYCIHLSGDSDLAPRGWIRDNWVINSNKESK